MGYLAQEASIFRTMTVENNLMAILETMKLSRAERKARAEELLAKFGLSHVAKQKAITLKMIRLNLLLIIIMGYTL